MMTVKLYRAAGNMTATYIGQSRADSAREAIRRVAKRMIGYGEIGLLEHFPGGNTYHVQFVTGYFHGSTSLSDKYVAQVE